MRHDGKGDYLTYSPAWSRQTNEGGSHLKEPLSELDRYWLWVYTMANQPAPAALRSMPYTSTPMITVHAVAKTPAHSKSTVLRDPFLLRWPPVRTSQELFIDRVNDRINRRTVRRQLHTVPKT